MSNAVRIALAGSVIFAALAPISQAHATPVTWTFFETSCTAPAGAFSCPAPAGLAGLGSQQITFPYALATLTLPGPTSSGSAVWFGGTPTYTGDTLPPTLSWMVVPEPSALANQATSPFGGTTDVV